jgi:hypothetical protein
MCRIIPDRQVPHWTGTHGEMISLDLHGAEEPTRWMLRPQQEAETDQRVCTGEEQDIPPEAAWQSLTQGGCALSIGTLALEGP